MLPCEYVEVSLVSIGSPSQPADHVFGFAETPTPTPTPSINSKYSQKATVLYLTDDCDRSFVDVSLVRDLFRAKYGPETPIPHIDNDTRVALQLRHGPVDQAEVTIHQVLRDSRYQVILRKADWERPIQQWLQLEAHQRQQQKIQNAVAARHPPQQKVEEGIRNLKVKSEMDSPRLHQEIAPLSPAPSDWDEDEEEDKDIESDFEWSEVEIIESMLSEEGSKPSNSSAYWTWSGEHQSWFHKNEDQTITWFEDLGWCQ